MAHTKSSGATKYGRDSQPKYLGIKKFDGERVHTGDILVRQRGTKFYPGVGVRRGNDDTLFALCEGLVKFTTKRQYHFDGTLKRVRIVQVAASSTA